MLVTFLTDILYHTLKLYAVANNMRYVLYRPLNVTLIDVQCVYQELLEFIAFQVNVKAHPLLRCRCCHTYKCVDAERVLCVPRTGLLRKPQCVKGIAVYSEKSADIRSSCDSYDNHSFLKCSVYVVIHIWRLLQMLW